MNGGHGIVALIMIFLEEARGDWVPVASLAKRMALDEARVVQALHDIQHLSPGADLTLQVGAHDQVTAARLGNGALEAA